MTPQRVKLWGIYICLNKFFPYRENIWRKNKVNITTNVDKKSKMLYNINRIDITKNK